MSNDDLHSTMTVSLSPAAPAPGQHALVPVRSESLARWARAVTAPFPQSAGPDPQAASESDSMGDRSAVGALTTSSAERLSLDRRIGNREQQMPCGATRDAGDDGTGSAVAPHESPQSETARTLPLAALRGLHANHRQARLDAGNAVAGTGAEDRTTQTPALPVATAEAFAQRQDGVPLTESTSRLEGDVSTSSRTEQLHSLVESCCSRLWVSDGMNGSPQGVLLDLGRWMPGCTLEVAKASGVLRISMRGIDADRLRLVEEELDSLGDGLAQKLGCQVVVAVDGQKNR